MALDSDAKRFSALNIGNPWRGVNYFPTGTVDAGERLALLYLGSSIAAEAPVEVPDVVGETQAAGTSTLEGDGFVVSVTTAHSSSVAEGLIISQEPEGGEFASSGSTVTITVSLGAEPVEEILAPRGGDDAPLPQKDYRPELDEKRLRDKRELREIIERAAGLIADVVERAPEAERPEVAEGQAAALNIELGKLRAYADELSRDPQRELAAIQERVDGLIAKAVDELVVQVADLLTELIQEIAEEDDAA